MSHHFDTATARRDPRLNLCDFYLFRGRPGHVAMILTVNPNAGVKASDTFHEEGLYAFRFDLDGDAQADVTFSVRFGEPVHGADGEHTQSVEVRRATGADARAGGGGSVVASGSTGAVITAEEGVRLFAGLAPELFAANREGLQKFRSGLQGGEFAPDAFHDGTNFFGNRNVSAIALEVPVQMIATAGHEVHAWATISLFGHAPETQVSRWGLPLMTNIFILDEEEKEQYNRTEPSQDTARFSRIVSQSVERATTLARTAAEPAVYADEVTQRLFPTTMPYVLDSDAAFDREHFNGRALTDNVMDVMLSLMTNATIGNGVQVDTSRTVDTFPYVGAPVGDPVRD
ncbi:protein of unknown function [Streptomyces sp. DvalAA-14]|uniref:DUF4331 family protein n=1 Tax=Streptomyces sp. SID4948 TaxID=2690287 RepID=UPI00081B1373|nr:DUF4331 domain-containing protein [Streptomyces sp. SID4948]SCD80677.1 protein of unknown function [Streptomyces sp. DvalAA-14]